MRTSLVTCFILLLFAISCKQKSNSKSTIWLGGDLSYVNEMLDCGGKFRSSDQIVDPFRLFAEKGANIVRVRLWNDPDWTNYSDYQDVEKTIKLSKQNNMAVLLDFHYSDDWADPSKQIIPKAWEAVQEGQALEDSVYTFTKKTLIKLHAQNLVPDFVQIGNEINIELMQVNLDSISAGPINWDRNAQLINAGLRAVDDFNVEFDQEVSKMLHIAQPENALWWFKDAMQNGVTNFEWIGLSYYPKWSEYGLDQLGKALDSLKRTTNKRLMIVETAYPHSLISVDGAGNILGEDSLIPGFPPTHEGQRDYMIKLTEVTISGGGEGVIYWEPAWISNQCSTRWGQGSHWENSTFFDETNNNEALPVFEYLKYNYEGY
ncbi:MAG: glycosyl hydrolase 53 family protein [Cyclobacteriaceae bacterium]